MSEIDELLAAAMGLTLRPPSPANPQSPIPNPARETNAAYHADFTHVGSTMLRKYAESPALYEGLYVSRTIDPKPQSAAMLLGSLMHCLLEGEDRWREEYLLADGCAKRQGNLWLGYAEEAAARGLTPILHDQLAIAKAMAAAIRKHPTARQLIEADGHVERTIRWRHPCGLKLKCRLDRVLLADECDTVIDLKSSADPRPDAFVYSVRRYRYDLQAALYLDGLASLGRHRPADFVFCAVRNAEPFDVWLHSISPEDMDAARAELDDLYHRLQRSLVAGDWTAPKQLEINVLHLPGRNGKAGEPVNLVLEE